jgi:hypothetical protein
MSIWILTEMEKGAIMEYQKLKSVLKIVSDFCPRV